MRQIRWSRVAINLTVLALIVIWTVPTLGLFITSFRDKEAISNSGWWTAFTDPQGAFTLENYEKVLFGGDGLANAFLNTLAVTIPAVVIPILIAAFAAYGFAWLKFPGRRILFITVVALLVVPLQIALIPVLKANGTFLAVWLAHAGFGLALATYLLYNYISQLPKDLIESAAIDGASHFTTFRKLILPLSMPALASFAIFQFLWVWNDLLVASTFLGNDKEVQVMTQVLVSMTGSRGQDWQLLTAGAFVSMILPVLVFLGLQRYFVRGMLAGSVKG